MFPTRYFAPRYFAVRYWPPVGEIVGQITVPKTFSLSITVSKDFEVKITPVVPIDMAFIREDNTYELDLLITKQQDIDAYLKQIHNIKFIW